MIGNVVSGGGRHDCNFYDVISTENLLCAWKEFSKGKRLKEDVALFEMNLENNLFDLHRALASGQWRPDPYEVFFVHDPKLRKIHKATVKDRVLYQAVYRSLYQIFDSGFIFHSFSSRNHKGTHRGTLAMEKYIRNVSKNYTNSGYVLKCDIRKFFDSIDHNVLFDLIKEKVTDESILLLVRQIIDSFSTTSGKGLPLGNVTSQLFANVYMNELVQYVKRVLKTRCYVRYCDDFGIVAESKEYLEDCAEKMKLFCKNKLLLDIHPRKISINKISQGVDFLGYILLPHRRVLRTHTKIRLLKKISNFETVLEGEIIKQKLLEQSVQSYLGVLSHCKGEKIATQIERLFYD